MRFWPSSPRRRRRLAWIAAATSVVTVVIAVIIFIPSHGGATKQFDRTFVAPDDFGSSERADEARFASEFIHDLAARRNLGARYDDLTPSYRRKQPRSAWVRGSVPIPPQGLRAGSDRYIIRFEDARSTTYVVEIPRRQQPPYEYYSITIKDMAGRPLIDAVDDNGVIQPVPTDYGNHEFGENRTPNWLLASILYGAIGLVSLALAVVAVVTVRRARRASRRFAYPSKPMPTLPGQSKPETTLTDADDHDETRDGSV